MKTYSVLIYKDFHMTQLWSEEPFTVDIKEAELVQDFKGRVHNNSDLSSKNKVSRFNKLSNLGGVYEGGKAVKTYYGLTVNGKKAFFTIIH